MESQVQEELMVWKGKRTKRQRLPSPLRLATPMPSSASSSAGRITSADNSSTSSPELRLRDSTQEEEDMANCLILLAQGSHPRKATSSSEEPVNFAQPQNRYVYQCKTCNRCFPSFQALGGHRASHKKPKPEEKLQAVTFLIKQEDHGRLYDHSTTTTSTDLSLQLSSRALYRTSIANNKAKVHECSICGAEFSSGQALGGHMRRHRTFANMPATASSSEAKKPRNVLKLDLNLPAPEDDLHGESKFPFQSKEKVIVFSASSLVDCHY
ncbi:hypothetical protein L6164_009729 [Bauhinia variegata]|uniref:Uncharacterized protein n=1 Tax=Bauhinia variegata TaxID=167791 RepID=A0ACB9PK03_BAUVA|nr:hypothetical protein L6164_009729 [Bauhinia variegata]